MYGSKRGFRSQSAAARKLHYRLAQQLTLQSVEKAARLAAAMVGLIAG